MKQLFRITSCCLLAACAAFAAGCSDDDPTDNPPGGGTDPISVEAKYALGARTENAATENYRIVLSATELRGTAEAPKLTAAGQFLTVVLHADEQEPNTLPEGTYSLVDQPAAGQGDLNAARLETTDAQGNAGAASQVLLNGSVRVSHTAAGYKIEVTGQLSGQRALSYAYEGAIDFGQKPGPTPLYDVEITAQYALGTIYSQVMDTDGSSNFFITLSDIEPDPDSDAEMPMFGEAGQFVQLDLYAIELEPLILPEGSYNFTDEEPMDKQGSYPYSGYNTTDETGEPASPDMTVFSELAATVSYTDDGYKIDAVGKLSDGRTFHVAFEGMLEFEDAGGGGGGEIELPGLEGNVQTTFTISEATYLGEAESGASFYSLDLYDNDLDQNYVTTNRLTVQFFTQKSDNPLKFADGTFYVGTDYAAGTFLPGSLNIETIQFEGTYCEQTVIVNGENQGYLYGMVSGGEVEIKVSGNQYTVTADVIDSKGNMIQGTYTGEIVIKDRSFISTLPGDKQVNLTGKTCEMVYYADYYGAGGDNWSLFIYTPQEVTDGIIPADGSEAFQIELIAPTNGFAAGLPAGDYNIAPVGSYTPGSMICLPGRYSNGDLYESWYMGEFDQNIAYAFAPFTRGKVNVARSGAQYTFTIDVYDDAKPENNITATWTGTPYLFDESDPASVQRTTKRNQAAAASVKQAAKPEAHTAKIMKPARKSPRW